MSLLGDADGGWREFGDTNSLCPKGTHRCIPNPEDSRQCLWIDSHKGHHTPKCQMGKTFQLSTPSPSHSTDIIHQAGKILSTGYKALERNGKNSALRSFKVQSGEAHNTDLGKEIMSRLYREA